MRFIKEYGVSYPAYCRKYHYFMYNCGILYYFFKINQIACNYLSKWYNYSVDRDTYL